MDLSRSLSFFVLYDVYAFPESEINIFGMYISFFSCLLEEKFDNMSESRMQFDYLCISSKCKRLE